MTAARGWAMLARMDDKRSAEARQMVVQVALELEKAAEAARRAVDAGDDRTEAWKQLQQLYTRFDEASQLLRDMRRTVDAAFPPH